MCEIADGGLFMDGDFGDFKEQVRSAADIVEIISAYVPLKKRGQNYWGCCPFHGEKTPSFAVNPSKDMFYCFGCHEGGDVFKFIMKIENCNFVEALKLLAGKCGIAVPEKQKTAAEIEREKKRKRVIETNELASKFFQACLLKTDYGKEALTYLTGRGVTSEIIERFGIGYALNNFGALVSSLGKRGYTPQLLFTAGLALRKEDYYYDKFRNRVMIPIKDPRGRIVGFGGRVLDDSTPKYLNTGETDWFNKRRILFGFDIALKSIRSSRQAIVVEGYMDAISLHAADVENVVASMGTAFAEEQAKLLKRATDEVVFCYDSDSAGRRASVRAVTIAKSAGLKVRVAAVPDGKDPDEFIRKQGKDAFLQVISNALDGVDFQVEETISQSDVTNLAGKVDVVSNIIPFLLECKSEIEIAEHIRRLAQKLTIDESLIMDEYRKVAKKSGSIKTALAVNISDNRKLDASQRAEEMLLAIFVEQPYLSVQYSDLLQSIGFSKPEFLQIFNLLCTTDISIDKLNDNLDENAQSVLAGILTRRLPEGDVQKVIEDCLLQLQRAALEKEYEKHRLLADEYERSQDERFMKELMESQRIKNEIKKLYGK